MECTPELPIARSRIGAMMPAGLVVFKTTNQLLACFVSGHPDGSSTRASDLLTSANIPVPAKPFDYYSILQDIIDNTKQNPSLRAGFANARALISNAMFFLAIPQWD